MALRGLARRHRLVGILVFELIQRKIDAARKPHGFRDRLRQIAKQPRHFVGRLQIAFGIGFETPADGVDGGFLADASQNILQGTARRMVIQHLVGRQQRHARRLGDALEPHQTAPVVAAVQQAGGQPHAIGAAASQLVQNAEALWSSRSGAAGSKPEAGLRKIPGGRRAADDIRPSRSCRHRRRACRGSRAGTAGRKRPGRADRPGYPACRPSRRGARRSAILVCS